MVLGCNHASASFKPNLPILLEFGRRLRNLGRGPRDGNYPSDELATVRLEQLSRKLQHAEDLPRLIGEPIIALTYSYLLPSRSAL